MQAPRSAPRELPFAQSPWSLRYEVGRLGFAYHPLPWRGRPHSSRSVLACRRIPICLLPLRFFKPKRKGATIAPPKKSTAARPFEQDQVTPDSGIYSVPIPTATRDSPSGLGRWHSHGPVALSRVVPLNRYAQSCQNASSSAGWITRGLTAVLLITPNLG